MLTLTKLLIGAAILAVLAAAVLIGYYMVTMRGRQPEKPQADAARRLAPPAQPRAPAQTDGLSTANANLPDASYEEEEMPTVVVARPPRAAQRPRTPPPQRTSGATIIAFDDDEDEDSQ